MVVVIRRIDFLILLIPTPLVSVLFCSSIQYIFFIYLISHILKEISIIYHQTKKD